jgi:excisionase family DNA binding protein
MKTEPNFHRRKENEPAAWTPDIADHAFLTPAQVAAIMQIDVRTVYTAIRSGRLPAINWGVGTRSCYRIDPSSLTALSAPNRGPS